jgi:3-dehydroquinate synthetase
MAQDKKVRRGSLTLVLVHGIGKAFIARDAGVDDIRAVLDDHLKA